MEWKAYNAEVKKKKKTEVSKDWPLVPGLPAKTLANSELKQGGSILEPAF